MTYLYEVLSTGETIEVEQSIKEPAHEILEVNGSLHRVRRLISGAPKVLFMHDRTDSCGWADSGYAKHEAQRKCDKKLGRS